MARNFEKISDCSSDASSTTQDTATVRGIQTVAVFLAVRLGTAMQMSVCGT